MSPGLTSPAAVSFCTRRSIPVTVTVSLQLLLASLLSSTTSATSTEQAVARLVSSPAAVGVTRTSTAKPPPAAGNVTGPTARQLSTLACTAQASCPAVMPASWVSVGWA
ncbi:MAG: hypothetical protein R2851_01000 [Caldilineaceae bacterium]